MAIPALSWLSLAVAGWYWSSSKMVGVRRDLFFYFFSSPLVCCVYILEKPLRWTSSNNFERNKKNKYFCIFRFASLHILMNVTPWQQPRRSWGINIERNIHNAPTSPMDLCSPPVFFFLNSLTTTRNPAWGPSTYFGLHFHVQPNTRVPFFYGYRK